MTPEEWAHRHQRATRAGKVILTRIQETQAAIAAAPSITASDFWIRWWAPWEADALCRVTDELLHLNRVRVDNMNAER